jgi:hypothetical protein
MSLYGELFAYDYDEHEEIIKHRKEKTLGDKKAIFFAKGVPAEKMEWLDEPVIFDDFAQQVELYFAWVKKMHDKRSRYMAKGWLHRNLETNEKFMKQVMKEYEALLKVARVTNNNDDQYLCPNVFSFPTTRQASTVREIQAALSDIDQHKIKMPDGTVASLTRIQMYDAMNDLIEAGLIPRPNVVIEGQGTQGVWLHEPVPFYVENEWQMLQTYLNESLQHLGADPLAKDVVRFMRAAGSVHSGTGEKIVMKIHSFDRYKFEDLLAYVPNLKVNKRSAGQKKRKRYKTPLDKQKTVSNRLWAKYQWGSDEQLRSLHLCRLQDLETLRDLRNGDMLGCREMACFLYHLFHLRANGDLKEAYKATWAFYQSFKRVPGDEYTKRELDSRVKSSERNWNLWVLDHESAPYNFTPEWIIEKLNINRTEQKKMITIIDGQEKQRRNTEYVRETRRANGVKERNEYNEEQQNQTQQRIEELKQAMEEYPSYSNRKLAKHLGISESRVRKLKQIGNI